MVKKVVVYSYYSPEELTGIGKYNGEMIQWLLNQDVEVLSFSNVPFYPYWKVYDGCQNRLYAKRKKELLTDVRTGLYIPSSPGAKAKIISELTFAITSTLALMWNWRSLKKSDVFLVINPPFFLGTFPLLLGKMMGIKTWFHIQDLQVDAARELKLLPTALCKFLEKTEKWLLNAAGEVSTISTGMVAKIRKKQINKEPLLMPNWADLETITPNSGDHWLHEHLGLDTDKKLIVYSGNIGEKQGLDTVLRAAALLHDIDTLHFVILGEGLYKNILQSKAEELGLSNLILGSLVPKDQLGQMLNSSFIQLVIQKSEGADSFLPSKLTNILSAGCASIVTAKRGTSLGDIIEEGCCAMRIEPNSSDKLARAIRELAEDNEKLNRLRFNARKWAEYNLAIDHCLALLLKFIN